MARKLSVRIVILFFSCLLFIPYPVLAAESQGQGKHNLILIVINSLRPDHLSLEGYPRATSPQIDILAKESIYFDQAFSQSCWTLPSLATIFTSQYLSSHKLDARDKKIGPEKRTFTQILKGNGYATNAFTCGLDAAAVYGLEKGFDRYDVYSGSKPVGVFSDMLPKVKCSLRENKDKKFFLFLHSYDTHPPYRYNQGESFDKGYKGIFKDLSMDYNTFKGIKDHAFYQKGKHVRISEEDSGHIIACYDDAIRQADNFIGSLIAELKALSLYDKTVIILCSDHGEELGERGTFNRFGNQNLYQEVVRVPLLIRYPGIPENLRGRRIRSLAGLVDIAPTALSLLGISSAGDGFQGISLRSFMERPSDKEKRKSMVSEASRDKWMLLRSDGWKLVHSPGKNELYDLNSDPGEKVNLVEKKPQVLVDMLQESLTWRQAHYDDRQADNRIEFDPKLIDNLRKSGYW
jgi:arylsulfatase A-like enzyme